MADIRDAETREQIEERNNYYMRKRNDLYSQWRKSGIDIIIGFDEFALRWVIEELRRKETGNAG